MGMYGYVWYILFYMGKYLLVWVCIGKIGYEWENIDIYEYVWVCMVVYWYIEV